MAIKIGELFVDLKANIARFTSDLDSAQVKSSAVGTAIGVIFGNLATKGAEMATRLARAFPDMIAQTIKVADELERTSQQIGIGVESLQKLQYAARQMDVSNEELTTSLARFAKQVAEAGSGSKESAEHFQRLGISIRDASGNLRPLDELFLEVADRFSRVQDGAAKTAISMGLFGRGGFQLIQMLNKGKIGLEEFGERLEEIGGLMDSKTVAATAAVEQQLKDLNEQWKAMKRNISEFVIPSLSSLLDALNKIVGVFRDLNKPPEEGSKLSYVLRGLGFVGMGDKVPVLTSDGIKLVPRNQIQLPGDLPPGFTEAPLHQRGIEPKLPLPVPIPLSQLPDLLRALKDPKRNQFGQMPTVAPGLAPFGGVQRPPPEMVALNARLSDFDVVNRGLELQSRNFDTKLFTMGEESIRDFNRVMSQTADRIRENEEAMKKWDRVSVDIARSMTDAFGTLLFNFRGFRDFFAGLLQDIGKLILQLTIMQPLAEALSGWFRGHSGKSSGSTISNVLGSIGSGIGKVFGFAGGGVVPAGMPYIVGERGPELRMDAQPGLILPNNSMRGAGAVAINYNIDARGADPGSVVRIERLLRNAEASFVQHALVATHELSRRRA